MPAQNIVKITVRPAPDDPRNLAKLDPEIQEYVRNVRRYSNDVEQSFKQVAAAIAELQKAAFPH